MVPAGLSNNSKPKAIKLAAIRCGESCVKWGLKANTPKRFKLTTDSRHSFPVAANVLDRNFDVDAPNKVWTADISYVWTFEGWLVSGHCHGSAFSANRRLVHG